MRRDNQLAMAVEVYRRTERISGGIPFGPEAFPEPILTVADILG